MKRYLKCLAALGSAIALTGCAVGPDPRDPFEHFNRAMYSMNEKIDTYALKPTAEVYRDVVPDFAQTGIYNFFSNIGDVWTAVNNLLQGKVGDGVTDIMRVAVNTVFGFAGVLDIASEAGMPRHKQDFGTTLGVWGVGSGPYVVLPFFGPSTLRDSVALPIDIYGDPWSSVRPVWQRNSGRLLRIVDLRAGVLDAVNLIEEAALDRYEFVRDGFLQRRASKIGDVGLKPDEDSLQPALSQRIAPEPPQSPPLGLQQTVTRISGTKQQELLQSDIVEPASQIRLHDDGIRLRFSPLVRQDLSSLPPS